VIGQFNEVQTVRQVFERLFEEYLEASSHINDLNKDLF